MLPGRANIRARCCVSTRRTVPGAAPTAQGEGRYGRDQMARVDIHDPRAALPDAPAGGGTLAADWPGRVVERAETRRAGSSLATRLRRDWVMILLVLPGLLYFTVFYYVTAFGYVIAFQDYRPYLGLTGSPFVGLENF